LEGSGHGLIDLPGGTEENHENPVRIADVPVEILTEHLPDTNL
jgi:hypothetical protein